jgi:hypothetical protein
MPGRLYDAVARRARHRCEYCLAPEALFNTSFELDHIVPRHRGGSTALDNLALACRLCNACKGTATHARDPLTRTLVSLFHPRMDRWDAHFELHADSGRIEGRDARGRASVIRLRMNSVQALDARCLWLALRVF